MQLISANSDAADMSSLLKDSGRLIATPQQRLHLQGSCTAQNPSRSMSRRAQRCCSPHTGACACDPTLCRLSSDPVKVVYSPPPRHSMKQCRKSLNNVRLAGLNLLQLQQQVYLGMLCAARPPATAWTVASSVSAPGLPHCPLQRACLAAVSRPDLAVLARQCRRG